MLFRLLAALALVSLASATGTVHELTPRTIESYLSAPSSRPLLLEFYAPWCAHCVAFAPAYEELARTLGASATVARVDGSAHRALTLRFRVAGFPALFLVSGGRVHDLTARRTPAAVEAFVRSRGRVGGAPHAYFFGPLAPYWRVVGAAIAAAGDAARWAASDRTPRTHAAAAIVAVALAIGTAFFALIYCVTKPKPFVSPPRHAHRE